MRVFIVSLIMVLTSCAAMESTSIRSDLQVYEYNEIARQYMDRPTYVSVRGVPGKQDLMVEFDPYGTAGVGDYAMFSTKHSEVYLALIRKFLDWEHRATKEGDEFKKQIGSAPVYTGLSKDFTFYSANERKHFLVVTLCAIGSCAMGMNDSRSLYFTKEGAAILMNLIEKLASGQLPGEDVSAKYN